MNYTLTKLLHHSAICSVFLLILSFTARGTTLPQTSAANSKILDGEKALMLRGLIGSRPPRCSGRCAACGPCQAVQVPATDTNTIAYARTDANSNYKPMCWKCKCGSLIFSP